ncbi:MAG TPA: hypothetical protein VIU61_03650, partial [Kofleriaceae bacterium]
EGVSFDAVVTHVHEQVGGSDKAPGMTVRPQLADDRATSWWGARVALPELPAEEPRPATRAKPITVRPRTHTIPEPTRQEEPIHIAEPTLRMTAIVDQSKEMQVMTDDLPNDVNEIVDDGKRTTVMDAVDPELLAMLGARTTTGEQPVIDDGKKTTVMDAVDPAVLEQLGMRTTGEIAAVEPPVVDDGKQTTVMESVDPAALGLETSASGSYPTVDGDDEETSGGTESNSNGNGTGNGKPRGSVFKRRKKKR